MQIIWRLDKCFVKDIISEIDKPRPPYNTVSSVVRILEKKGFVTHKAYGKTHEYSPIISKDAYSGMALKKVLGSYFNGSISSMVSFFSKDEKLDEAEISELKKILKENSKT